MSQTPPPFTAPAPQPAGKKGNPIIWIIIAVALFCIVAMVAVFFAGKAVMNVAQENVGCLFTVQAAQKGLIKYGEEFGELPAADDWQDAIDTYYEEESERLLNEMDGVEWFAPADNSGPLLCNEKDPTTYIIYNSDVAGKKWEDVKDSDVLIFEENSFKERNSSNPYQERDNSDAPTIMGEHRDWYAITKGDDLNFEASSSSGNVKIETSDN